MRVVVSGGDGVIGGAAVRALDAAGHDLVVLEPAHTAMTVDALTERLMGADALVSVATHVPVGYAAALPGAWRRNDELHTTGVANLVLAARRAGVRRVVQESVSHLYADAGDRWITESSPIEITTATEPFAVAESRIQGYADQTRAGVVLRFGRIIGDDATTRYLLRAAGHGRPIGLGRPESWTHVVHTDDLGGAVVAALSAPSGVYNVGAEPVRRSEVVAGFAERAGSSEGGFLGPMLRRLAGPRAEPMSRSLRVCSDHFSSQTGWRPAHPAFDVGWFDVALPLQVARGTR